MSDAKINYNVQIRRIDIRKGVYDVKILYIRVRKVEKCRLFKHCVRIGQISLSPQIC